MQEQEVDLDLGTAPLGDLLQRYATTKNEQAVLAEVDELIAEGVLLDQTPYCQMCGAIVTRPQMSPRPHGAFCSARCWQAQ